MVRWVKRNGDSGMEEQKKRSQKRKGRKGRKNLRSFHPEMIKPGLAFG